MIKIQIIKDFKDVIEKNRPFYKKIDKGYKIKSEPKTLYFTPKTFYSTFTPERIKLIQILREKNKLSISEIARKIGRPFESVHRDIRFLEGLGLINIEKRQQYKIPVAIKKVNFNI